MPDYPHNFDPRLGIWDKLRSVAKPDSRLHFDFAHIHPDFEGSNAAVKRMFDEVLARPINLAFVVPDGAAQAAREELLRRGVRVLQSTFCMRRGFRLLDPARIAAADYPFAATLDGVDRFGIAVSIADLASLGRLDLMLTGAAGISSTGARFGRSYQYFDIEWGIMAELGIVGEATPVGAIVHDVQLIDSRIAPMPHETVPDFIATPSRLIRIRDRPRRPTAVYWDGIDPDEVDLIPALQDLQRARGERR